MTAMKELTVKVGSIDAKVDDMDLKFTKKEDTDDNESTNGSINWLKENKIKVEVV